MTDEERTCRGSIALGSGCRVCKRCKEELARLNSKASTNHNDEWAQINMQAAEMAHPRENFIIDGSKVFCIADNGESGLFDLRKSAEDREATEDALQLRLWEFTRDVAGVYLARRRIAGGCGLLSPWEAAKSKSELLAACVEVEGEG